MFCGSCGQSIPSGAKFCSFCGQVVASPTLMPPPLPPSLAAYSKSPPVYGNVFQRPIIITVLAILNFVAAFFVLGTSVVLTVMFLVMEKPGVDTRGALVFTALLLPFGFLYLAAGIGLWKLKPFGRTMEIIFACLGLFGFPLGTIISILILVYLFKPEVKLLFSGLSEQQLSQYERDLLARFSTGGGGATTGVVVAAVVILMIFIGGIIAAIAIPNLLNAVQRAKQKRTMADIRAIGTAVEAYAVDHNSYPDAESIGHLAPMVEPTYIRKLPRIDGWARSFTYQAWKTNEEDQGPQKYLIVSAGKDGELEHEELSAYSKGGTASYNNDIVFSGGEFIQFPEGIQQ
jgi:type II secretory pathway pseudopilin PulG